MQEARERVGDHLEKIKPGRVNPGWQWDRLDFRKALAWPATIITS